MSEYLAASLVLEDGTIFPGRSFGFPRSVAGEVVFNTGMVGYPQSLTDPSYAGQILAFTYPLIGNYGVQGFEKDEHGIPLNFESNKIQVRGVIVSEFSEQHNHWGAKTSLASWLKKNRVPGIFGVDTRALTIKLREKGVMLGKIVVEGKTGVAFTDPNKENLVAGVSRKKTLILGKSKGAPRVIVVDCGIKNNILRCLLERGVSLKIVPWDYDFAKDLREEFDGAFVSNGPGDPTQCIPTIKNLREAMRVGKPVFGICLGNQLLALAAGAKTFKLKYGHRGQNQPCICVTGERAGKGFLTAQNHGYAVDAKTLPKGWRELFYNANDCTNEGIAHESKPFFSVQFHPEGSCGPRDSDYLFNEFVALMKGQK